MIENQDTQQTDDFKRVVDIINKLPKEQLGLVYYYILGILAVCENKK